jgi:peroxiredoxin Q/BCP
VDDTGASVPPDAGPRAAEELRPGTRVGVGDRAPLFELPATGGVTVALADHLGRPVILAFYPADNTPVCTAQLVAYTKDWNRFEELDAAVLALSPQSVESHEAFAAANGGFAFPLLADVDKSVGRAYGVVGPLGFYRRSIFVLDPTGTITYAHRSPTGLTFRGADELAGALRLLA